MSDTDFKLGGDKTAERMKALAEAYAGKYGLRLVASAFRDYELNAYRMYMNSGDAAWSMVLNEAAIMCLSDMAVEDYLKHHVEVAVRALAEHPACSRVCDHTLANPFDKLFWETISTPTKPVALKPKVFNYLYEAHNYSSQSVDTEDEDEELVVGSYSFCMIDVPETLRDSESCGIDTLHAYVWRMVEKMLGTPKKMTDGSGVADAVLSTFWDHHQEGGRGVWHNGNRWEFLRKANTALAWRFV